MEASMDPPELRRLRFPFFISTISKSNCYSDQAVKAPRGSSLEEAERHDAKPQKPRPSLSNNSVKLPNKSGGQVCRPLSEQ